MSSGDPIFQTTLQDLVKGVRAHKKDISLYISQKIAEIKNELRSTDTYIKAEAVRKITYLQMIGYDVSWASFGIVEVMSQPKFAHKRIGYLAANQSFNERTDVILLTTNLFKKEFTNSSLNQYEIGLAINCLANIATPDLARDCIGDLVMLMNHQRPYIRKKAILAMYKLYVRYPQGLRLSFDKLKDKLEDSESSVVSTAVNVICELANKNPKNYLAMAPKFFRLLTTSSNNWMLIKVVKLLGSLVSEEPRLARKLLDPLATIIQNTGAKSLQYECIHTITEALPYTKKDDGSEVKNLQTIVKLCSDYLRGFIEDSDQNLKYLGLVGLVDLMKSHPKYIVEHRGLILRCLDDDDITIRTRALDLLSGIVSKKSLIDLVTHLLSYIKVSEGTYRDEIISKILYICSKDKFTLLEDFAWYCSILLELSVIGSSSSTGCRHGRQVADQLIEVVVRVDSARPYAVESMLSILLNEKLIMSQARHTVSEVLKAAAWVIGEYSHILSSIALDVYEDDDEEYGYWIVGPAGDEIRSDWRGQSDLHFSVMSALLHPRVTSLPFSVQSVYMQSALKVFLRACQDCSVDTMTLIVNALRTKLAAFTQSVDLEVQERASFFRHLLSELGILSANWKADLEDSRKHQEMQLEKEKSDATAVAASTTKKHKHTVSTQQQQSTANLLDINGTTASTSMMFDLDMLESTAAPAGHCLTADEVDQQGARVAKQPNTVSVLQSLFNEAFYAVHAKAQRRVPVPEEINLEEVHNSKELSKILAIDILSKVNLSDISFTSAGASSSGGSGNNMIMPGLSAFGMSGYGGGSAAGFAGEGEKASQSLPMSSTWTESGSSSSTSSSALNATQGRSMADSLYYLQSNNSSSSAYGRGNLNNNPLAQILADTFEDHDHHKVKKGKKGKVTSSDGKKKSKKAATSSTAFEVNTREVLPAGGMAEDSSDEELRESKPRRRGGAKTNSFNEDETDLSAIDLTTPLRADEVYSVFQHRQVTDTSSAAYTAAAAAGEKAKKVKKSKKKHSSSRSEEHTTDLLEQASHHLNEQEQEEEEVIKHKKKDKKSKKEKSTTATAAAGGTSVNNSSSSSSASEDLLGLDWNSTRNMSNSSSSSSNGNGSGHHVANTVKSFANMSLQPSAAVAVAVAVPQQQHVTVEYLRSVTEPYPVDEQTFMSLIQQYSSKFVGMSFKVTGVQGKAKTAFKTIAKRIGAALIESENSSTKAVSLCAKTSHSTSISSCSNILICLLIKYKKDAASLSVDLKCAATMESASSRAMTESVVKLLAESIQQLSL